MFKNKKIAMSFLAQLGSLASIITSVVMFAKKKKTLGGFFLALGLVSGIVGSFMQFEESHSDILTDTCGCGDPDCEDCCGDEPEEQEDCDIDEGDLFARDEEAE